jgi:hypothetical protein
VKRYLGLFTLLLGLSMVAACRDDALSPAAQVGWLSAHQSLGTAGIAEEVPYCGTVRCPKCGFDFWRAYSSLSLCRSNASWAGRTSCPSNPRWFCHWAYNVWNACYFPHC